MTTTSTFQGMESGAKPSSRVLAAPGGGSSISFGNADESPARRGNTQNVNKCNNDIFGTGAGASPQVQQQVPPGTSPGKRHNPENINCGNNDIFNREQHSSAAQPKSRAPRSEFNPITGESYEKPAQREDAQEEQRKKEEAAAAAAQQQGAGSGIFGGHIPTPSTRVNQPPGGRSTKLW